MSPSFPHWPHSSASAPTKHHPFHGDKFRSFVHEHKHTIGFVIPALQGLHELVSVSPLSPLAPALSALTLIVSTIMDADGNDHDSHALFVKVAEHLKIMREHVDCSSYESIISLQENDIRKYIEFLKQAQGNAEKVASQNPLKAFFQAPKNKTALDEISRGVEGANVSFLVDMILAMNKKMDQLHAGCQGGRERPGSGLEPHRSFNPKNHAEHSHPLASNYPTMSSFPQQPNMRLFNHPPPTRIPVPEVYYNYPNAQRY